LGDLYSINKSNLESRLGDLSKNIDQKRSDIMAATIENNNINGLISASQYDKDKKQQEFDLLNQK